MKDFSKETIRKFAELAGYTFHTHNTRQKDSRSGAYIKVQVLKAHDPHVIRSIQLEPCNQYKPWEDVVEADRLLNSLGVLSTIRTGIDSSTVKLSCPKTADMLCSIGSGKTRQEAICRAVENLIKIGVRK